MEEGEKIKLWEISQSAQLASALEVSAYPKPGNVHRTSNLKEINFEKFIASSIVIGPPVHKITKRGFKVGKNKINPRKIGIGRGIKESVERTIKWTEENTNFGILMLLVPLAAAAGKTLAENKEVIVEDVRNNLSPVLKNTTTEDALNVYKAISLADLGGLGDVDKFSAQGKDSDDEIEKENVTLYDLMEISAPWDNISKEWTTNMPITFELGFPSLKNLYKEKRNLNKAIVQTYLKILSKHRDSLIQRKNGEKTAKKSSKKAKSVLEKGGVFNSEGEKALKNLDEEFKNNNINPGTTADLVASSLMVAILNGLRP